MTEPVVLVGRRSDGGHRDRLWAYCQAWLEGLDWPVHVGEHHAEEGPWNLSKASNRAAAQADDWRIALYAGADVVLGSHDQARAAVDRAASENRLVFAHDHYYSLSAVGTERVLAGEQPHGRLAEWPAWSNTFSSMFAITRDAWDEVGGFDERFIGPWGGEDIAMWSACCAVACGFERVTGPVFHLWHVRDPAQRELHPNYPATDELMNRYLAVKNQREPMLDILREPGGPLDR